MFLVDVRLPDADGAAATRRIKELAPQVGVLFLTVYAAYFQRGMAAGAAGCHLKDSGRHELLRALADPGGDAHGD